MRRAVAAISVLFLLSGCELLKGLQNRKVLGAAVLATPEVTVTPVPGTTTVIPAQVSALVYFGERQDAGAGSLAAPVGVTGATVTVGYKENGVDRVITLRPGATAGQYKATEADALKYLAGVEYEFKVVSGKDEFTGTVTPPAPSHVTMTPPGPTYGDSYAHFDAATLTFARSGDDLAFYGAWKVNATSARDSFQTATCTNLPLSAQMDPYQLVDLILDTSAWQQSTYTLAKAACFPQGPPALVPAPYLVGVGIGRKGTFSDNLFSGSVVFAGVFDAQPLVFAR